MDSAESGNVLLRNLKAKFYIIYIGPLPVLKIFLRFSHLC